MRQDPPAAVAPVIPARAPGGVSARRSGVATLAKPNVRPGVQSGWPVRRLASCAPPAGVSARIHASGWLPGQPLRGPQPGCGHGRPVDDGQDLARASGPDGGQRVGGTGRGGMAAVADGDRLCPGGAEHPDEPVQFRGGMGLRRPGGSWVAGERWLGVPAVTPRPAGNGSSSWSSGFPCCIGARQANGAGPVPGGDGGLLIGEENPVGGVAAADDGAQRRRAVAGHRSCSCGARRTGRGRRCDRDAGRRLAANTSCRLTPGQYQDRRAACLSCPGDGRSRDFVRLAARWM